MGFIAALNYAEGKDITMKLLLLTILSATALAEDAPAEEVKPVLAVHPFYQHRWPEAYGAGFSSTVWGGRPLVHVGKRSADAEPEADPGLVYAHPFGYYPVAPLKIVGPDLTLAGKDEGVAAHPGDASAWTQRSAQGAYATVAWGRKRRSAEADPGLVYALVPVAPAVAPIEGEGVAAHPNLGTSKISPT